MSIINEVDKVHIDYFITWLCQISTYGFQNLRIIAHIVHRKDPLIIQIFIQNKNEGLYYPPKTNS